MQQPSICLSGSPSLSSSSFLEANRNTQARTHLQDSDEFFAGQKRHHQHIASAEWQHWLGHGHSAMVCQVCFHLLEILRLSVVVELSHELLPNFLQESHL